MKTKKSRSGVILTLKDSFQDYPSLFKVFYKDLILVGGVILTVLLYMFIIKIALPKDPGFNPNTLMSASQQSLDSAISSLQAFYATFIIASIIGVFLLFAIITIMTEWTWSGMNSQKPSFSKAPKFFSVLLIIYIIAAILGLGVFLSSGFLLQKMAEGGVSFTMLQISSFIVLIILIPILLQIINFSNYTFSKTKRFGASIIEPFKSFSKITKLLLPYLFTLLVFIITGTIANILILIGSWVISVIVLLIFILFMSWQKLYSFKVFEQVYK